MRTHNRHLETVAVHAGMEDLAETGSHVPPIDLSTTNPLPSVEDGGDAYEALATGHTLAPGQTPVYQRLWQPGVARFEEALGQLEGTSHAVAFASGMAALSACLIASVTRGLPHVVALRPLYGGSDHVLATGLLGTSVTWCASQEEVAAAVRPETGLVVVETPANPTCELVDIEAVVSAAGEVPVLVDNTFATPVLQQPALHGARLVLHSATKFLGGHHDVLLGAVVCRSAEDAERIGAFRNVTGNVPAPDASWLLLRSLETLPLRMERHTASATELARRLAEHPAVERVRYPGFGGMLSFDVAGGGEAARRLETGVQRIVNATSLGGTTTTLETRFRWEPDRVPANLVRLSVGLEPVDELWDDLNRALSS